MAHGTWDNVVPLALAERSRDVLLGHGYDVEWHTYPIPHSVCAEEIDALRDWLLRVLPARAPALRAYSPRSSRFASSQ